MDIKNKRVYLRAFEFEDVEALNSIRNEEEAYKHTGGNKFFISSEYDKKWIEDKIFNNKEQIYLAICLLKEKQLIGYVGLNLIDFRNNRLQWAGINIHKEYAGNGYGTEAANLLIQFVFEELGMNSIYGYWLVSNLPSIKMAKRLGFSQNGVIRDFVFKQNKYHDALLMSMLRVDYNRTTKK